MTTEFIRTEVDGNVGILTLNRPDRLNAANNAMEDQFFDELRSLFEHPDVRVLLWRAEGRAFSAGRDINDLGNRPPGASDYHFISQGHGKTHALLVPPPKPVVCAIQGWCIGGVWERTMLCDIRIASDDAKFKLPELTHGLIPDSGGTARLFQMCGHGIVSDLVLTGRTMDADEALRYGVISRVVSRDELDSTAYEAALTIAALPPLAVSAWRNNLNALSIPPITANLHAELLGQMLVYKSEDFAEFKRARADKRPPVYRNT